MFYTQLKAQNEITSLEKVINEGNSRKVGRNNHQQESSYTQNTMN